MSSVNMYPCLLHAGLTQGAGDTQAIKKGKHLAFWQRAGSGQPSAPGCGGAVEGPWVGANQDQVILSSEGQRELRPSDKEPVEDWEEGG